LVFLAVRPALIFAGPAFAVALAAPPLTFLRSFVVSFFFVAIVGFLPRFAGRSARLQG
jgi:hypothetical protein